MHGLHAPLPLLLPRVAPSPMLAARAAAMAGGVHATEVCLKALATGTFAATRSEPTGLLAFASVLHAASFCQADQPPMLAA